MATRREIIGKERNWLDDAFDSCTKVREIGYALEDLSGAFYRTGNEVMAEKLSAIAGSLQAAEQTIHQAVAIGVQEDFKRSQQSSKNVFLTALAMAGVIDKKVAAREIKAN